MFVKERLPNGGKTLWNALENREASQGLSDVMGWESGDCYCTPWYVCAGWSDCA